MTDQDFF